MVVLAAAPEAFPWTSPQLLEGADGTRLSWSVSREEGRVVIEGTHTRWSVVHVAQRDGTPLSTVKRSGGKTARIVYRAGGADFTPRGREQAMKVEAPELWDAETLDARLAGVPWSKGKALRFSVLDVDSADGAVYPMVAEGQGLAQCGPRVCQVVKVTLDGWRRPFGPTLLFRYGTDVAASYLGQVNDGVELQSNFTK
ncbi:MAG: hypothetical protein IPJ65_38890 [Archangiaceae bacterium]|nr:hypothetical protein [Archangiaceae bacterium]